MTTITDRQKDSEIIARLIYMAFVAPERANINIGDVSFVPFAAALELYARAAARENVSESDARADAPCNGDSCPVELPEDASEPDKAAAPDLDGFEPVPLRSHDTHTHTHTAGATDGEGRAPGSFVGYGSGEKRDCFARITEYVISHGPGAKREIANAGDGSITLDDVIAMCGSRRVPLSKWRAAAAALDRLEGKDQ